MQSSIGKSQHTAFALCLHGAFSYEAGGSVSEFACSSKSGIMRLAPATMNAMDITKTFLIFILTAIAEIAGCYFAYLWLRQHYPVWILLPSVISLALFAWLLTLHPAAAGRVYAAYGGVYIAAAIVWLWAVDSIKPTATDLLGVAVCLLGAGIIMFGPRY
jgi:small multidrug resistance family-3 protein